jgi:predicted Holliday junction resolvase-like endonuclease
MTLQHSKLIRRWGWISGLLVFLSLRLVPEPLQGQIAFGLLIAVFVLLLVVLPVLVLITHFRNRAMENDSAQFAWQNSVEDRLDELERLKRRAMVTPEEYEAKREEILRDL